MTVQSPTTGYNRATRVRCDEGVHILEGAQGQVVGIKERPLGCASYSLLDMATTSTFSFVDRFNNPVDYCPTRKLRDLTLNVEYKVHQLKRVITKFGVTIVVKLYDVETESYFDVFLPARISRTFANDDLSSIVYDNLYLTYHGMVDGEGEFASHDVRLIVK